MPTYPGLRIPAALMIIGVIGGLIGCTPIASPVACIDADPSIGSAPLTVRFDASCSFVPADVAGVYGFAWDFDDGTAGTGRTITHTFTMPGTYMVSVGMHDSGGIPVGAAVRTITVLPAP